MISLQPADRDEESSPSDFYLEWARRLSTEDVATLLEHSTWRLIELAPRDGTPIMGWDIDPTTNPTGTWVVAHWRPAPPSEDPAGGAWVIIDGICSHILSHWMPLPPQPPPIED